MTTDDIIMHLQDDPILASLMYGVIPDARYRKQKAAFWAHYIFQPSIGPHTRPTIPMLARQYNRSEATIYQWISSIKLYLRNPHCVRMIKAYLKHKERERHWFWRTWSRVRALWPNQA